MVPQIQMWESSDIFLPLFWTTMTDSFIREVKTEICFHRHARIYY